MLFLLLFVIIVWFFVDYFIHVFGTPKKNNSYDYVNFDTFYREFDIRTKHKKCEYDSFDKEFNFTTNRYFCDEIAIFSKYYITFYDDSTKMMILINPLDYLKYRWFWIVLKYNYKKRNYEQGLFDRKDNLNE